MNNTELPSDAPPLCSADAFADFAKKTESWCKGLEDKQARLEENVERMSVKIKEIENVKEKQARLEAKIKEMEDEKHREGQEKEKRRVVDNATQLREQVHLNIGMCTNY
jgi:hypothetical protein